MSSTKQRILLIMIGGSSAAVRISVELRDASHLDLTSRSIAHRTSEGYGSMPGIKIGEKIEEGRGSYMRLVIRKLDLRIV